MPIILTENLTKFYGRQRGIEGLDLEVQEGEVFGFLGPNGAGKTTTIRLLMGLLRPDSGTAAVGGLNCWRDAVEVKKLIGYLPSDFSLDPNLTGGEIIAYLGHLRGGVDRSYVADLAGRLDLELGRKFRQYSHGNRQKVGIVQAFMHRPRLLILDEPTTGLDPLMQQVFANMVHEARNEGHTVFLSSHVLSEAERLCDRVGIIRDGRLVQVGTVEALRDIKRFQIDLTFARPVPPDEFRSITGVERVDAQVDGTALRLIVQGDVDAVMKAAAAYPIRSVVSHEPSLEDIFLRYYQQDSPSGASPGGT